MGYSGTAAAATLVDLAGLTEQVRLGWGSDHSFLQVTPDALVYSTFLLHVPRPAANLSILRTSPARIPLECRYPRSEQTFLSQGWWWWGVFGVLNELQRAEDENFRSHPGFDLG